MLTSKQKAVTMLLMKTLGKNINPLQIFQVKFSAHIKNQHYYLFGCPLLKFTIEQLLKTFYVYSAKIYSS